MTGGGDGRGQDPGRGRPRVRRPGRSVEGVLDARGDAPHLVADPRGLEGRAHDPRRDQQDQLGLLGPFLGVAEQVADDRDPPEERNARVDRGLPRSWMSPPRTSVWLFSSTTEVSASRFLNSGDSVGGTGSPTSLTSCFTSSATVPSSPMRGVTVRTTPASLILDGLGAHDPRGLPPGRRDGRGAAHGNLLRRQDRDGARDVDHGLLVLGGHDRRVRQHVQLVVRPRARSARPGIGRRRT